MYRFHFTLPDLARTRVAESVMPLSELCFAILALQSRTQPVRLQAWRKHTLPRLSAEARMVTSLFPPDGWFPGFLTPVKAGTPEELLEAVRSTPRSQINTELAKIAEMQKLPTWAHHLPDDEALRQRLYNGLANLQDVLLAPYWTEIGTHLAADRALRMRHMLSGGIERLLSLADPVCIRWKAPVLETGSASRGVQDVYLEGQGILLVPSAFCIGTIVDLASKPQPTITYSAKHDQPLHQLTTFAPRQGVSIAAISALLGHTRAAVLNAVSEHPGCSTKELALLAKISPASASEHATVLREAGLVRTLRHRNAAVHSSTALGITLLNRY